MKKTVFQFLSSILMLIFFAWLFAGCGEKEPGPGALTGISLNKSSLSLEKGSAETLKATLTPANAADMTVTWTSDNESVATVSGDGLVTGISEGKATITASVAGKNAFCSVTVILSAREIYESERALLMTIYEATGGEAWKNNDNWGSDKPLDEWYGVETNKYGQVSRLILYNNNLTGQIPPELFSLPGLLILDLGYNSISGVIPEEVGNAEKLREIHLQHNYLTGSIPESLYGLSYLNYIELWSNQLSGELSEQFWTMPALVRLSLHDNRISGALTPAVAKATKLEWLGLGNNSLKGTIPEEITQLAELRYFDIDNLAISNGAFTAASNEFTGPIPDNLDKLKKLQCFLVANNDLEGTIPSSFAKLPDLVDLHLNGNRFSGEIPDELLDCRRWDDWAPDKNILTQQEGYILSFRHYESTDFSQDGIVIRLQTHEKGNGINIVITGDFFTDKDIASGVFEQLARQTMEDFFGIEPFTTFRNLFDVYAVVAVSKTQYSEYGTALSAIFGEGSYVRCDEEKVKEYSRLAVTDLDETLTIVIVNQSSNSGTAFMPYPYMNTDYGSGFSYACFGLRDDVDSRRLLINHEANGHGFTKLQDEYIYRGSTPFPEDQKQVLADVYFSKGYYANIDLESDPEKVKWARLLADERYNNDGLGLFEGGMGYENGVWRPSYNSIMGYQAPTGDGSRFNAPSRLAAYYRIHKLAYGSSWEFDYEEFVDYDAINRQK